MNAIKLIEIKAYIGMSLKIIGGVSTRKINDSQFVIMSRSLSTNFRIGASHLGEITPKCSIK